ncbi:MAG: hypothetical protein R3A44_25550 [Caldilineaceae bacterium]
MNMETILLILLNANKYLGYYGSVETALRMLLNNELATILDTISAVEMNSARRALKDAELSNFPVREVSSAITSLRTSLEADKKNERSGLEQAVMISFCYYALGERKLAIEYMNDAIDNFSIYRREYIQIVAQSIHMVPEFAGLWLIMVSKPKANKELDKLYSDLRKVALRMKNAVVEETLPMAGSAEYHYQINKIYQLHFESIKVDSSSTYILGLAGRVYADIAKLNWKIGLTRRNDFDHTLVFYIAGWLKDNINNNYIQKHSQAILADTITKQILHYLETR